MQHIGVETVRAKNAEATSKRVVNQPSRVRGIYRDGYFTKAVWLSILCIVWVDRTSKRRHRTKTDMPSLMFGECYDEYVENHNTYGRCITPRTNSFTVARSDDLGKAELAT